MSWSKVHSDPDVYEVRVPFQNVSTSATNCFVVMDGGEALVVDTGAPTEEGAAVLDAALDEIGVERSRATFFLTHLHLDHAGLVDRVAPEARRFSWARPISTRCGPRARQPTSGCAVCSHRRGCPCPMRLGTRAIRSRCRCSILRAWTCVSRSRGTRCPSGGGACEWWRCRATRLAALLCSILPRVFCSAAIMCCSSSRRVSPYSPTAATAFRLTSTAWRRCALSVLAPVRGPWGRARRFEARIDWLRAHHLGRLEEAQGIVRSCPGLSGEEVVRSIKWNVPFERWEDISFMQRWCIVMEGLVFLNHLVDRGLVRRDEDEAGVRRYF